MKFRNIFTILLFSIFAFAGTTLADIKNPDGSTRIAPNNGTDAPATCSVAELFFDTNESAGANLLGCTSTNTWSLLGGGGAGVTWTGRSVVNGSFKSVTYAPDIKLWVAVDNGHATQRVMTSPDGMNWTLRTSPSGSDWQSVTYGNGLFVAVAENEAVNPKVMTSPDGITWTTRTASSLARQWKAVAYGKDASGGHLYVAVADDGSAADGAVMTSPDGITWTARTASANAVWNDVAYGNGLWVAVAGDSFPNQIMTSADGVTWTNRTSPVNAAWKNVEYANGLWVAVAFGGAGNRVATSPDGINWTQRSSPIMNWTGLAYGNGMFVAVASNDCCLGGSNNRVMTSPDGITWTQRSTSIDSRWLSVAYGNGVFAAVSDESNFTSRVMTSGYNIDPTK